MNPIFRKISLAFLILSSEFFWGKITLANIPNGQIFLTPPISHQEIFGIKKEIITSYEKKGMIITSIDIHRESDYSLSGYVVLSKQNKSIDHAVSAPVYRHDCAASKGLDGLISWKCNSQPPKKLNN